MSAEEENFTLVKDRYLAGKAPISQMIDAVDTVNTVRLEAANSQYDFFKELLWVQRALVAVNWATASDDAKGFITRLKQEITPEDDINVNL